MLQQKDISFKKTNLNIHYEEWFNKNNNNTIVILHGWGGSSQSWLKVGELLYTNGYNVIIPDLPGFGKTPLKYIFDLDEYAKVIEEFLKNLNINDFILWGHSNGGAISIKLSIRGNIKIKRLVLNNSAGIRNDKKRNTKRKVFNKISGFFKIFKNLPFYTKIRELFYRFIGGQDYINAEKKPYLRETYLNMIKSDLKDLIPKITQNTLLIWGGKDTYTPISDGKYMRNHIKNSKICILENEKHGIHLTSPIKLVDTFLNNI